MRRIYLPLAIIAVALAGPARAGGAGAPGAGATEMTQMMNNVELVKVAIDQAQTAATTVQQYALQIQQFGLQNLNIARIAGLPGDQVQDAMRALQQLGQYRQALGAIQGSLGAQLGMMQQRMSEARMLGVDWKRYAERVSQDVASGSGRARARIQQENAVLEQVQADYAYARQLQDQIPNTVGQHQAIQLLNSQMNRVVTQNARMIEVLSTTLSRDGLQSQKEAEAQDNEAAQRKSLKDREDAIIQRQRAWTGR